MDAFPQVLMCYHPNKQIGNSQLASKGRIIAPSFHLSSILMAERDKQSVNAPGVCVITRCMPAKATHSRAGAPHSRARVHTQMRRNMGEISKSVFSTSVRIQLSREDSRRESGKQKEEKRGGGREQASGVRLVSVHLSSPSQRWTEAH